MTRRSIGKSWGRTKLTGASLLSCCGDLAVLACRVGLRSRENAVRGDSFVGSVLVSFLAPQCFRIICNGRLNVLSPSSPLSSSSTSVSSSSHYMHIWKYSLQTFLRNEKFSTSSTKTWNQPVEVRLLITFTGLLEALSHYLSKYFFASLLNLAFTLLWNSQLSFLLALPWPSSPPSYVNRGNSNFNSTPLKSVIMTNLIEIYEMNNILNWG